MYESESAAETEPAPKHSWNRALVWSTFGLLGWLAFELTAHPGLAATIACSKFGWDDFVTALWLRRHDPRRARGRACSWFCLAIGLLKTMLAALGLLIVVMFAWSFWIAFFVPVARQAGHEPPMGWLVGLLLTFLLASPVLLLATFIGCVVARLGGVRVWIDRGLARSRRQNLWPPDCRGPRNHATLLVILMIAGVPTVSAIPFALAGGLLPSAIVAMATLVSMLALAKSVISRDPARCWPPEEISEIEPDDIWLEDDAEAGVHEYSAD